MSVLFFLVYKHYTAVFPDYVVIFVVHPFNDLNKVAVVVPYFECEYFCLKYGLRTRLVD